MGKFSIGIVLLLAVLEGILSLGLFSSELEPLLMFGSNGKIASLKSLEFQFSLVVAGKFSILISSLLLLLLLIVFKHFGELALG